MEKFLQIVYTNQIEMTETGDEWIKDENAQMNLSELED